MKVADTHLKKTRQCEDFGHIVGDAKIEFGNPGCAEVKESELGRIIAKAIIHLPYEFPVLKPLQFKVMPDHVHLILQVLYRTGRHLDFYVEFLQKRIAAKYSKLISREISEEAIFIKGYCDKPLFDDRNLDGWYVYLRLNPHRLAMRLQYPQFFRRIRKLKIGDREFDAYGNLFLFRNPDKIAVKISSKNSAEENSKKKEFWLSEAAKGAVLVSPFISKEEKAIRAEAESVGASIILITHEAFPERFKPAAHDFNLCSSGRLLIISLGLPKNTELSREICQQMNALAEEISGKT